MRLKLLAFVSFATVLVLALVAAIRANPGNYYVNVHTRPDCLGGVIRGQFGDHGP